MNTILTKEISLEKSAARMKVAVLKYYCFAPYRNGLKTAWQKAVLGLSEDALNEIKQKMSLDQIYLLWWRDAATITFFLDCFEQSITYCKEYIDMTPCDTWTQMLLAHSYVAKGEFGPALQTIESFFKIYSIFPEEAKECRFGYDFKLPGSSNSAPDSTKKWIMKHDQGFMSELCGDIFALQEDYDKALINYQNASMKYLNKDLPESKMVIEKINYIKTLKNVEKMTIEQKNYHDIAQDNNCNVIEKIESKNQDESYF